MGAAETLMVAQRFEAGRFDETRAGFVLLDLIVTAAIAGLLLSLVLPSLATGTTPARMHVLLASAASMLRDARTSAIAENRDTAFFFDSQHRILSSGRAYIYLPTDVGISVVSGGGCNSGGDVAQIIFHSDGTSCGGIFRFVSDAGIYRLRVNWATGYVETTQG
jgi:general secretion pathway protein H